MQEISHSWTGQNRSSISSVLFDATTDDHAQGRTGSSNRPWLITQTGPISSGVNKKLRGPCHYLSKASLPSLAKGLWAPSPVPFPRMQHLTWRSTRPVHQPAHLSSARQPDSPVRPWTTPSPSFSNSPHFQQTQLRYYRCVHHIRSRANSLLSTLRKSDT